MTKKILSVLLAACCLMSAGCTDDISSQQDSATDTSVTSASSQTEAAPEVTTAATTSAKTEKVTTTADVTVTTAAPAPEEPAQLSYNQGTALELVLSGDATDIYVIDADCYVLTERTVIYVMNGSYVRGDLGVCMESLLDEVCALTQLSGSFKHEVREDYHENFMQSIFGIYGFQDSSFKGVNSDLERLDIAIVPLDDGMLPLAEQNFILLDDGDPYFDNETPEDMFTLLTGVVLRNNGVELGWGLDSGIRMMYAEKLLEQHGCHTWSWVQYYLPYDFDDSCIRNGTDGFDHAYNYNSSENYVYGFIFSRFLEDTYGEGIFVKLLNAATAEGFDASLDMNNEEASIAAATAQMKKIIISVTEPDVFDKFAQWYAEEWDAEAQKWKDYMTSIGEDVSFL